MPPTLQKGNRINGYLIQVPFDPGAMSHSAKALSPSGDIVFFKQYKLPTVRSSWYQDFVKYQKEMKRRIESSDAKEFCYRFLDFFESKDSGIRAYYQVFEFISGGKDLAEKVCATIENKPSNYKPLYDEKLPIKVLKPNK